MSGRWGFRRWTTAALSLCLLAAAASTFVEIGVSAPASAVAAQPRVTMDGGDVIRLDRPVTVRRAAPLGSGWTSLPLGGSSGVPVTGAGAVVLDVRVSSAAKAGTLLARAAGSSSDGTRVAAFARSQATGATFVTKLGPDNTVQVKATGGRPDVAVRVLGFVPETATLVVPESPPPAVRLALGGRTKTVKISDRAGVPASATAVVAALETSARRPATVTAWRTRAKAATAGYSVPKGAHTTLLTLTPSAAGTVSLRALKGSATGTLRVLAWSSPGTTLTPLARPGAIGTVKPGGRRVLTVAGRAGVARTAQSVLLAVNARTGARVRVWGNAGAAGAPLVDTRSPGGAVTAWVPAPANRQIAVRVTGSSKPSTVTAGGFVSGLGDQTLSFVPKAGTHLLGAGDVVAVGEATIVLAGSAEPVNVGDHVLVRPPEEAPFVGRVVSLSSGGDGRRTVSLAGAELADAFEDYVTSYDGPLLSSTSLGPPVAPRHHRRQASTALPRPSSIALPFFEGDFWSCTGSVPFSEIVEVDADFSGDIHFDLSLEQRSLDFSAKGRLSVTFTFLGKASVSCTLNAADEEWYPRIPIGVTGVAVKFGGKADFTAATTDDSQGGAFTATTGMNVYAGFYYYDGTSDGTTTGAVNGGVQAGYDGLGLSFKPALFIGVAPSFPPGVSDYLDAGASVAVGAELAVGVPARLRGPRCLDVTVQPFIETGAQVVASFFGLDAEYTWEGASWKGPETELYRGPCWGWTGSITYVAKGSTTPSGEGGGFYTRDDLAVVTPLPVPAEFVGGDIRQPFDWSASTMLLYTGPVFGVPSRRCYTKITGSGSGTHPFGGTPALTTEPVLVRDIALGTEPLPRRYQTDLNEYPVPTLNEYYGGDQSCVADPSAGVDFVYIVPDLDPDPHPLPFWATPTASHTWDNGDPEINQSVTYSLTRVEFERE